MLKSLVKSNELIFNNKIIYNKNILKFSTNCKQLSVSYRPNHRFSEFERVITSEKLKAKNYLIIEDKCNVLSKLNADNCSQLLETKVNKVFKWGFNENNLALIELNDQNYDIRRDIRRRFGLESKKPLINGLKFITLNHCPKELNNNFGNKKTDSSGGIQRMTSRRKDSHYLNVLYLRQYYKSNEELLRFLLFDKYTTDLDLKLRFYLISQLERFICQSYFMDYQILPFGSSIAGLGTPNSDLDLVLVPKRLAPDSEPREEDRQRLKSNLNLIADLLQHSIPFYSNFSRILKARIPIVKFGFDLAPIDIDLSLELSPNSVHSGLYMSSFLNYCIQLNPMVRDFILLLRIWAKQHKLLKPKNWSTHQVYNGFTSFQLTALVIYYLQKQELVPSMNQFLNNSQQIFRPLNRHLDCIQLLSDFFDFILSQRFNCEAISILNGNTFPNPDSSPIYMENPFETELNMCRNVTALKFEKFLEITNSSSNVMKANGFHLIDILDQELGNTVSHNTISDRILDDLFSE